MLTLAPRLLARALADRRPRGILLGVITVWALVLVGGCVSSGRGAASPTSYSGPPRLVVADGFEAQEGSGKGAGWWLSSANGTLLVLGRPSTTAFLTLTVSPSPCGPARLRLAERDLDVPAGYSVSLSVRIATSGQARVPLFSHTNGCHLAGDARALYAFVSGALVTPTPATNGAQPADGFGGPEQTSTGDGFWMISPEATILAHGAASTPVLVSMTLAAPPCGATRAEIAGRAQLVRGPTRITVRAVLGRDGTAMVPISTPNLRPCQQKKDPRTLRLFVSDISVRRA